VAYHGLAQIFEQEGQGGGGVGHSIGAMQNDKGVEGGVVELDFRRDSDPVCGQ
jgi:hypothetical protein